MDVEEVRRCVGAVWEESKRAINASEFCMIRLDAEYRSNHTVRLHLKW